MKTNKYILAPAELAAIFVLLSIPPPVFAAVETFKDLVKSILDLGNIFVQGLVALSVIIIIFGVFRYFVASGDKERLKKGKDVIVYGIIGIIVIYSIVGVISLLLKTIVFDNAQPEIPQWDGST